jgi:mono/diheme cytochrome c family protein
MNELSALWLFYLHLAHTNVVFVLGPHCCVCHGATLRHEQLGSSRSYSWLQRRAGQDARGQGRHGRRARHWWNEDEPSETLDALCAQQFTAISPGELGVPFCSSTF